MSFEFNTITSDGAALIAQATAANPIVIIQSLSSATAAESLADLATKPKSFYDGKTGIIFSASATDNVARVIMSFDNTGLQSPQLIKSACILARLQSQSDADAVIMAALSDSNSQISIPDSTAPITNIHIAINISIDTDEQVATVGAQYASAADLERFVSTHKAGNPNAGDNQTIRGNKTFLYGNVIFNCDVTFAEYGYNVTFPEEVHFGDLFSRVILCDQAILYKNTDDHTWVQYGAGKIEESGENYFMVGIVDSNWGPHGNVMSDESRSPCYIKLLGSACDSSSELANNDVKIACRAYDYQNDIYYDGSLVYLKQGDNESSILLYTKNVDTVTYENKIIIGYDDITLYLKNPALYPFTEASIIFESTDNDQYRFRPEQNKLISLGDRIHRWANAGFNTFESLTCTVGEITCQGWIDTPEVRATTINGATSYVNTFYPLCDTSRYPDNATGLRVISAAKSGPSESDIDFRSFVKNVITGVPNGVDDNDRFIGTIGIFAYVSTDLTAKAMNSTIPGSDLYSISLQMASGTTGDLTIVKGQSTLGGTYVALSDIPVRSSAAEVAIVLAIRVSNS